MPGQVAQKPTALKCPQHVLKFAEPPNTVEGDEMSSQEYIEFVDNSLQEFFDNYPYWDVNLNVIQ